jgi:hypothetical protein
MSGVPVEVSARKITVPYLCPCCCGVADSALAVSFTRVTGKQRVRETTRELDFPYCSRCVRHSRSWSTAQQAAALVMACGVVAALVAAVALGAPIGVGAAAVAGAVAATVGLALRAKARAACSSSCAGPGPAVTYHGWAEQVQRFSFASRRYAAAFAEENEHSLVNVTPHLYQLVEQHRVAAPPAAPARKPTPAPTRVLLKPTSAPKPTPVPTPAPKRARATEPIPPSAGSSEPDAAARPMQVWPQRVDHGRSLLENVMRIDARALQAGGIVKRTGRLS